MAAALRIFLFLVLSIYSGYADPGIKVSGFSKTSNRWDLTITTGLTNHMEVFHSSSMTGLPWQISATGLIVNGAMTLNIQTNSRRGYFVIGNGDLDSDHDSLPDAREALVHQTDPGDSDTDNDTMPDGGEVAYSFSPKTANGLDDSDEDGVSNSLEYMNGTIPTNHDTDGDGFWDGADSSPTSQPYFLTLWTPAEGSVSYQSSVQVYVYLNVEDSNVTCSANGTLLPRNDEAYDGYIVLGSGRQAIDIKAVKSGVPVARLSVAFTVDTTPPEFTVESPTNVVTEENVRVVVWADGSNYTGTANTTSLQREGYRYSAWVHVNGYDGDPQPIQISMSDPLGRISSQTLSVSFSAPTGYSPSSDADGDGVANQSDLFPWDASDSTDSDADGRGANAESQDPDPADGWTLGPAIITWPPRGYVAQ